MVLALSCHYTQNLALNKKQGVITISLKMPILKGKIGLSTTRCEKYLIDYQYR